MAQQFHGIITPLVTPFDARGDILERDFQANLDAQVRSGVHGLVILATAGEAPSLSLEEKKRIVDLAHEANHGRLPLMVGVGGVNARETFTLIEYAEAHGADGLFVITPYFYRFTRDEYLAYFREISRRAKTQVFIYNSTYAGVPLDPPAIAELAQLENIVGLKEGNPLQAADVMRLSQGRLKLFTSRDIYLQEFMSLGGSGGFFFSSPVVPELAVELYECLKGGDFTRGRTLLFGLMPLVSALVARSYPAGIKAAMNLLGRCGGHVRFPLRDYEPQEVAQVRAALSGLGLL